MAVERTRRVTMRARPFQGAERALRRPSIEGDFGGALSRLVSEIAATTPFERVVVVAGFHDLHGAGRGVAQSEIAAFARALGRRIADADASDADAREEDPPLAALASMRSPVLLHAPVGNDTSRERASEGLTLVAVVETDSGHPALRRVSDALRSATPTLVLAAELHALRTRLAETESLRSSAYGALDALPDPVLVTDARSHIVLSNRRATELFGDPELGDADRRHAVEANNLFLRAFQAKMLVNEEPSGRAIVLVDPDDGSDLLFEVFALPAQDQYRVVVLRDVTDLNAAARELEVQFSRSVVAEHRARREGDRLDSIIQNAAVPIFVTDNDARIQLINREAARLLEPRPGTAPTSPRVRDLEANHAKLTDFVRDLLLHARARNEGRLELVEPEEARELTVLAVSTKILDERGEATAVVTVLHDLAHEVANHQLARTTGELTERNTRLQEQQSALERAARSKNEFLATMSHELRTPINAILGYNSLLRDGLFGQPTERQRDALDRMRTAAEHLLSLINDVLDLSRVEAGKVALNPADIEWVPFLEALSESLRPLAARKSLAYAVSIAPGLPGIRADPIRLRQVLLNLLTNAVKFTDRGWIELRVAPSHGRNRVQIDVTDTGIGIEETDLEVIFEEFTQVDQSSTREHGGAGLGLAISRRLIRAMGGSLTVTSVPGRGSTFRVELPLTPPSAPELSIGPAMDRDRSAR
jgi:signal transduction histidine kinase